MTDGTIAGTMNRIPGWVEPTRKGRWRARRRVEGRAITIACVDTEPEAWEALAAFDLSLKPTRGFTVRSWMAVWFDKRAKDGVHRSVDKERSVYESHVVSDPIAGIALKRLQRKHVVRFVERMLEKTAVTTRHQDGQKILTDTGRRLSSSTIKKPLALIKRALSKAADLGHVTHNVALGVTVPERVQEEDPWDWLRTDELAAIMRLPIAPDRKRPRGHISLKQHTAIVMGAHTGVRSGVLWHLQWRDVITTGKPHIKARLTKSGKNREVPLLPDALAAIKRWKQAKPGVGTALVFPNKVGTPHCESYDCSLPRVLRLAGVDRHIRWHDLRHTCAAHLVQGTWTTRPLRLEEVRDWLGHSSVTVTERYAHLAPDGLHDLARDTTKEMK